MTDARGPADILVVEDQEELAEVIAVNLRRDGHRAAIARDGLHALHLIRTGAPDLVILDLGLPRLDGMSLLQRIRADGYAAPVLILTARDAPADRVEGFDAGADDYVAKPFFMLELLARARALLRRSRKEPAPADGAQQRRFTADELSARLGLTLRQAAVAQLLAEGLSNPEIADALGISRYTARNHARDVLARLGVSSRGRVAAVLREMLDAP